MKYKIGDKIRLTKDVDSLEKISLNSSFTGKECKIRDILNHIIFGGQKCPYVIDSENNAIGDEQIEGLVRVDNWKKRIEDDI